MTTLEILRDLLEKVELSEDSKMKIQKTITEATPSGELSPEQKEAVTLLLRAEAERSAMVARIFEESATDLAEMRDEIVKATGS
jgi:uncharacterized protein with von Willebrand factor type A (vWA) domain